jgi:hypothetical protein
MSKQADRHGFVLDFYHQGFTVSETELLFWIVLPFVSVWMNHDTSVTKTTGFTNITRPGKIDMLLVF